LFATKKLNLEAYNQFSSFAVCAKLHSSKIFHFFTGYYVKNTEIYTCPKIAVCLVNYVWNW